MKLATSVPVVEPTEPAPDRPVLRPAAAPDSPTVGDVAAPDGTAGLPVGVDLLARLEGICAGRGLGNLAERLSELMEFIGHDLESFEREFAGLPHNERMVSRGASHLLGLGGKRLRPMCLLLAARTGAEALAARSRSVGPPSGGRGTGFDERVRDLAVAVELVHSATLLHDDVVDMSDHRRGAPATRAVYGNAASIFAGDWLLIEALRRVERCALPGLLPELFSIIEEMIFAESLQLENRGRLSTGRDLYFQVVEGKTASVFRWAMSAGSRAAGLGEAERQKLVDYGRHLGVAFQATDDLLDLTGDTSHTGKDLFADLREGKMTFPLIVALERDPALRPVIEEILEASTISEPVARRVIASLRETRAVEDCRQLARRHSEQALAALEELPESRARRALATVAATIVDRDL